MLGGFTGFIGCRYIFNGSNIVQCLHKELEKPSDNNYFDWNKLLSYLLPDLLNLLAAITVSIKMWILNIRILYCLIMQKRIL